MSQPFFELASARLREIVRPGMLCAFDFDGTLAPIARFPHDAKIPDDIVRKLNTLKTYARIAVITGRSLQDVRQRLGIEPDWLVGNHGLEGGPGFNPIVALHYWGFCRNWIRILSEAMTEQKRLGPGIYIEDKKYSLSLHYRDAPDPKHARAEIFSFFEEAARPVNLITGKCVVNVLPPNAGGKGKAMRRLCEVMEVPTALYIGDDDTDEDVFSAKRENWMTIRVEERRDSAADFFLAGIEDVGPMLDRLIQELKTYRA